MMRRSAAVNGPRVPGLRRFVNPVFAREVQSRMRSWRAPAILAVWLLITAGILWLVKTANDASSSDPWSNPLANTDLGRGVFDWVLFVMMCVLFFLIPGQAAGAIAGERERQTLVPLQVTLLSTRQLLFGKVLASSAFLLLLMVAALPVLATAYLIGGVLISEIAAGMVAVITTGILLATMGTAVSALTKRVQGAVVLSYLLALGLAIGPFLAFGVAAIVDAARGSDATDPPTFLLVPGSFVAVGDIAGDRFSGSVPSPWDGIYELMHRDEHRGGAFGGGFEGPVFEEEVGVAIDVDVAATMAEAGAAESTTTTVVESDETEAPETTMPPDPVNVDDGSEPIPAPMPNVPPPDVLPGFPAGVPAIQQVEDGPPVPYWVMSLACQAVLAGGLLFVADRRLRTPAEAER